MTRLIAILIVMMTLGGQPAFAAVHATAGVLHVPNTGEVALFAGTHPDAPKPVGLIAFVIVAAGVDLFVFVSFVTCLLGPVPHWRWRWLALILLPLGIGRATLNWTTGMVFFQLLYLHVPSASFSLTGSLEPQSISMGFPFFAFMFWTLRSAWLEDQMAVLRDERSQSPLGEEQS